MVQAKAGRSVADLVTRPQRSHPRSYGSHERVDGAFSNSYGEGSFFVMSHFSECRISKNFSPTAVFWEHRAQVKFYTSGEIWKHRSESSLGC